MAAKAKMFVCLRTILSRSAPFYRRFSAMQGFILRRTLHRISTYTKVCGAGVVGCAALPFFSSKSETPLFPCEVEKLIETADELYDQQKFLEIYDLLKPHKDSRNDEILWRLARAAYEVSAKSSALKQKQFITEAFAYVKEAMEINEGNFAVHKWYAILLDCVASFDGTKAKILSAVEAKEHLQRAAELNPKDATTLYSLGYWCFLFADMPWYHRTIAKAVYTSPPNSTYEEALQFSLQAEEVDPNFYSKNLLLLGQIYMALGDKEKAIHYLEKTRSYELKTDDDHFAHCQAVELLLRLGVKVK